MTNSLKLLMLFLSISHSTLKTGMHLFLSKSFKKTEVALCSHLQALTVCGRGEAVCGLMGGPRATTRDSFTYFFQLDLYRWLFISNHLRIDHHYLPHSKWHYSHVLLVFTHLPFSLSNNFVTSKEIRVKSCTRSLLSYFIRSHLIYSYFTTAKEPDKK